MITEEATLQRSQEEHVRDLSNELIEIRADRQLAFDAPHCGESLLRLKDDGQVEAELKHPNMYAIPREKFYSMKLIAALAGAGFSRGPDLPEKLVGQIEIDLSNELFGFVEIIKKYGNGPYSSYGILILTPQAVEAALDFAYNIGISSKISYEESLKGDQT
jgi:hypothetical protein